MDGVSASWCSLSNMYEEELEIGGCAAIIACLCLALRIVIEGTSIWR